MKIKPYWQYFKYVLEHKKNVFIECWKIGEYKHAFTHDLSKLRLSEFIPYARYFYIDKEKYKSDFDKAWKLHYQRNKHHPEHFTKDDFMGIDNIKHMVCDLKAMSRKFGGTAQEYYLSNYYKWNISRDTRYYLEIHLDLLNYNAPICEGNEEYWMTIEELIEDSTEYFKEYGAVSGGTVENNINDLLKPACDKYNINIYQLVWGR